MKCDKPVILMVIGHEDHLGDHLGRLVDDHHDSDHLP